MIGSSPSLKLMDLAMRALDADGDGRQLHRGAGNVELADTAGDAEALKIGSYFFQWTWLFLFSFSLSIARRRAPRRRKAGIAVEREDRALQLARALGCAVTSREAAQKRLDRLLRLDAEHAAHRAGHAEVGEIARSLGNTSSSAVGTWVCVPHGALTRPSKVVRQRELFRSWPRREIDEREGRLLPPAFRSSSAVVNGFEAWKLRSQRPMRFITAMRAAPQS